MLLLLVGAGVQAQSVATEKMDERFNDGTKLPYGWFTEGWTVKDGVIQTAASSGFSFDLESLMGGGSPEKTEPTEEPAGEPSEKPAAKPAKEPAEEPTGEPTEEPTEDPKDRVQEASTSATS